MASGGAALLPDAGWQVAHSSSEGKPLPRSPPSNLDWHTVCNSTSEALQTSMHRLLAHRDPVSLLDLALDRLMDDHAFRQRALDDEALRLQAHERGHPAEASLLAGSFVSSSGHTFESEHARDMHELHYKPYSLAIGYDCRCGMTTWGSASEPFYTAPKLASDRPTGTDSTKCLYASTEDAVLSLFGRAVPGTPVCLQGNEECNPCQVAEANNAITCALRRCSLIAPVWHTAGALMGVGGALRLLPSVQHTWRSRRAVTWNHNFGNTSGTTPPSGVDYTGAALPPRGNYHVCELDSVKPWSVSMGILTRNDQDPWPCPALSTLLLTCARMSCSGFGRRSTPSRAPSPRSLLRL